jgi:hypothetical protein
MGNVAGNQRNELPAVFRSALHVRAGCGTKTSATSPAGAGTGERDAEADALGTGCESGLFFSQAEVPDRLKETAASIQTVRRAPIELQTQDATAR